MSKRKNRDPGKKSAVAPVRTAEQAQSDGILQKVGDYIDQQIQGAISAVNSRNAQTNANLLTRLRALETILMEKLGLSKDDLANRVSEIQDEAEGLETVTGAVEKGDRVRIEIRTRTKDQADWQGQSRFQVENCGAGRSLGPELEGSMIGMVAGETRETVFGKDAGLVASITVNRVSRAPKAEEAAAPTETQDASPNAG